MDKISLFNYEAYYLDYLEGNLNEEDTILFMAFLDEHPECRLLDEDLPELEKADIYLPTAFKNELREPNLLDEINETNCPYFLIAAAEELLPATKQKELLDFVHNHGLEEDLAVYRATRLIADEDLVYPGKNELKQPEKVLVLWPYLLAAAASIVLALMVIRMGEQNTIEPKPNSIAFKKTKKTIGTPNRPTEKQTPLQISDEIIDNDTQELVGKTDKEEPKRIKTFPVEQMKTRPLIEIELPGPEPIAKKVMELERKVPDLEQEQEDLAMNTQAVNRDDMRNPIKPITKFISEKTNTPVDFKTGKAAGKDNGFFIKIGRIEVSHKKH